MPRTQGRAATGAEVGRPGAASRLRRWLFPLALAVASLPLWTVSCRLPQELAEDYSVGDLASIEIAVLEASWGQRLVGQPTRFGFHQIGPAHFYAQAGPYLLAGRERWGLSFACLLINALAVATVVFAAYRWFETPLGLVLLPLVAIPYLGYYEPATLHNYWGQYLLVLPFAALLVVAAAAAQGNLRAWPATVALASFVAQGYGSTLPALALLGATVLVWGGAPAWHRWRRSELRRPDWVGLVATAAVFTLFWAPTAIDELRHDPGNLARALATSDAISREGFPPLRDLGTGIGKHLAAVWLHTSDGVTTNSVLDDGQASAAWWGGVTLLALLAGAALVAARRRQPYLLRLAVLVLVAAGGALLSTRGVATDLFPYVYFWLSAAAAVGWLTVGTVALDALLALPRGGRPLPETLRAVALVTLALLAAVPLLGRPPAIPRLGHPSAGAFRDAVLAELALRRDPRPPLHLVSYDFAWPWSQGVLAELAKRGHRVSIANVQGGVPVEGLQGLMPRWLSRRPGSLDLHFLDVDPGVVGGLRRVACEPVLAFDPSKPVACIYVRSQQ